MIVYLSIVEFGLHSRLRIIANQGRICHFSTGHKSNRFCRRESTFPLWDVPSKT
jgi:hypothetical protein